MALGCLACDLSFDSLSWLCPSWRPGGESSRFGLNEYTKTSKKNTAWDELLHHFPFFKQSA
jgi:hypothetical protein